MSAGLRVNNIAPVGERPSDLIRGRVGVSVAGVGTIVGSEITGTPTTAGDLLVYDPVTDAWVIVNSSTFGVPLTVEDEGTPLTTAADTLNFVGAGVTATGAAGTKTITIPGGGLPWFNVKDYGAVGNGTTDDTAAINLAIAALNTATKGVLYFPAGTYKVTAALTVLTAACLVLGDGQGDFDAVAVTRVNFTQSTGNCFKATSHYARFEKLAVVNTYAGTPTAGSGIWVEGADISAKHDFEGVSVQGFYDNIRVGQSAQFFMHGVYLIGPVRYGLNATDTVNPDAGDFSISDSFFNGQTYSATAAIFVDAISGMKVVNCKFNTGHDSHPWTDNVRITVPTGTTISDFLFVGNSFEGYTSHAINATTVGTGVLANLVIADNQIAQAGLSTSSAILVSAANTFNIKYGTITGNVINDGSGASGTAIALTKLTEYVIAANDVSGFSAVLSTTSCGVIHDFTGGVGASVEITGTPSVGYVPTATGATTATWQAAAGGGVTGFATPAVVLGTAAAAGAATTVIRSDSTIVAFDATVPVTQALGDAAATGSVAKAARRDHTHGMPALSSATPLVASGSGAVGTAAPSSREDHVHPEASGTSAAAPAIPVWNVTFNGDGATTVFYLPAAPYDAYSLAVFVGTGRNNDWTISGAMLDVLTFGVAPTAGTNNISIDIMAAT